ncbi:MAG: acetyl-CoA acetyltransferase [Candidatus Methanolliviera sp. GoM_oil]|nr:MAG: acetyl-CoA acetyltransferase [Candidatus Methanolliviera sp. GoM_oil]
MRDVAIIGTGQTRFGRWDKSNTELFCDAALEAMEEANVDQKDIEALYAGAVFPTFEEGQCNIGGHLVESLHLGNIPATRFEGACCSATIAIRDAYMWVASGFYDIVLAGGTERALLMGTSLATKTFAMAGDCKYEGNAGITFPGMFAMAARRYSKIYDIPLDKLREKMAHVSIKNHKHGALNPLAQFYQKMGNLKVEDVINSRMICDPLTLMDCCPFSDGGAAAIIASADIARRYTDEPIYILGAGQGSAGHLGAQEDMTKPASRVFSSRSAFKQAGLGPKDIDIMEIHDCFTSAEIIASEAIGFFDWGKGADAVEEGQTDIGGRPVVNPDGGLMGKGHPIGATGAAQVHTIAEEMKGRAPKGNQVDPVPEIGMTDTLGGGFNTLAHLILGRSRR